jgi:thymidylate synthase
MQIVSGGCEGNGIAPSVLVPSSRSSGATGSHCARKTLQSRVAIRRCARRRRTAQPDPLPPTLDAGWPGKTMTRHPEYQYLDLLATVLEKGDRRIDRTGVGTLSLFGAIARFDLARSVPILTTKRVYWKTAIKEMLWFLTGGTSLRPLLQQNVHIWTDWPLAAYRKTTGEDISEAEFERRIVEDDAFASRWGELGPVYGKQWRRWLGPDGREYDQIAALIETLRTNPASRRMLFHAWNVAELDQMALPPCPMVYQYHVANGRLSCLLYQRSVDLLLGAPFNWVGASALQLMLAQQCNLELGEFVWVGGDFHVYLNHVDQVKLQLQREPRPFPQMRLLRRPGSIDEYQIDDFEVVGYEPHAPIRADVAV